MDYHTSVIKIDTSNPPGDETKVVNYLKPIFDRAGIPNEVLALDPKRANLVARLKGNGTKRPLIIMGHTDVVGVQREIGNARAHERGDGALEELYAPLSYVAGDEQAEIAHSRRDAGFDRGLVKPHRL